MTSAPSRFTLERHPLEPRFRRLSLASREWIAPDYVRVRLVGSDLEGFDSLGADDHMRLFFVDGPADSVEEIRASPSREYTPLAWGADWLDVEFAVHGAEGVGAPWSAEAPLGSIIGVGGPRGSLVPEGEPTGWMLAGDETAIPAIRRFAARIPAGAAARIAIEVRGADHELPIDAPVAVEWIHRGDAPAGSALTAFLDGLGAADRLGADPFVFVAAEQSIVKPGRALLERWDVDSSRAIVKGYWKRGEAADK
ncbi:siderophore-interacting protein [Microbacterium panaciterrae]|uniref:Siderophore-interacting protein n=1 Tax=Microbacterium panaciterrae TaxID=985759 RepID=A0ABP8P3X0_9MICO